MQEDASTTIDPVATPAARTQATQQEAGETFHPILNATDVQFASGFHLSELKVHRGLTVLHCPRETSATTLALTLAGRMKPKSGSIEYRPSHGEYSTPGELHRHIAFSGVPDIDYVERLVPVRSIVREQIAWISPWYRRTPSNIDHIERYYTAAERIGFTMSNQEAKHTTVGELDPLERFKLRICLALLARPEAELLIVDDIDQLRSLRLRAEFLQALRGLAAPGEGQALGTSVLAISANDDVDGIADATIQVGEALSRASAQGPLHLVRERIQQEVGQ